MAEERDFKISVGTAEEYEDYVAEIHFPEKAGFIISQEKASGEFEISLHSFIKGQENNFDYCKNIEAAKIPLKSFSEAFELAVNELKRLQKQS